MSNDPLNDAPRRSGRVVAGAVILVTLAVSGTAALVAPSGEERRARMNRSVPITFESVPPGAALEVELKPRKSTEVEVRRFDATPQTVEVRWGTEVAARFSLAGHADARMGRHIARGPDTIRMRLRRLPEGAPATDDGGPGIEPGGGSR